MGLGGLILGSSGGGGGSACGTGGSMMDGRGGGPTVFVSTDQWLESIKMARYSQHFKEASLLTAQQVNDPHLNNLFFYRTIGSPYLSQISRLTAQQLSDMGITLVGHQKKILHQARQLDAIM